MSESMLWVIRGHRAAGHHSGRGGRVFPMRLVRFLLFSGGPLPTWTEYSKAKIPPRFPLSNRPNSSW